MKHHSQLVEDYLDRLEIKRAKKEPFFVPWIDVKTKLDKKQGINLTTPHDNMPWDVDISATREV